MDWSKVEQARTGAQSASQTANEFSARGNTLADELRKAVGERFAESGVAKEAATARGDFLKAAPQARSDILSLVQGGNILSPTQQNAIMAAKRSSALVPLMAANTNQEAMFGTLEDLINAGTNAYKAEVSRRQGLAELAQGNYSTLLSELLKKQEEDRAATLFPIQKQQAEANLLKTKTDIETGGGNTNLQWQSAGGKVYTFNPKTGKIEEVKGVSSAKYDETDTANFANAVATGSMEITSVPQEIRGTVQSLADQIKASQPSFFQKIGNWFSGLFNK